jgi:hypothetical protein
MSAKTAGSLPLFFVAAASLVMPPATEAQDLKPQESSLTVPLEPKLTPLELTLAPIVFHSVFLVIGPPKKAMVTVTVVVKASNPGKKDTHAVVKATLFDANGTPMTSETKTKELEEGDKRKDIKLELKVRQELVSPQLKCKLDLSVP